MTTRALHPFRTFRWLQVFGLTLLLVACNEPSSARDSTQEDASNNPQAEVTLEPFADGFTQPLFVTHAGDGSDRLFVVEQRGQIRVIEDGDVREEPFLDVSNLISCCGERGLLGLAFHPDFEENGLFYVNYTNPSGNTVVAAYRASDDLTEADPDSGTTLLTVPQPYGNHNGGHLVFGPDGYLYIGLGDGGSGGDPEENGQDLSTLLGALLRIDVDGGADGEPYGVPESNPFVDTEGARPEIWAYGLRNPWRFSFDRETGDLWIGDVGQNAWEEIDFQPVSSAGGENYGWDVMEGAHCFEPDTGCDETGLVLPVLEYPHSQGSSVTGGYRYRGAALPELVGTYLFGDFTSGRIWGATETGDAEGSGWSSKELLDTNYRISTFGEDEAGELYVIDYSGGALYKLTPGE